MVDETNDRYGQNWSDADLDAIVADYFAMLDAELRGETYVKAAHRRALVAQIGRTESSVEFKHQNISAVLEELGAPRILGYRPMPNYQDAILDAIERYLDRRPVLGVAQEVNAPFATGESHFIAAPQLAADLADRPARLVRLIAKFDPAKRDAQNRELGKAGEEFVLAVEREKLERARRPELARGIRWVAQEDGDGAGFDILSFEANGMPKRIEVKTTNGPARTPFFLSANEHRTAASDIAHWHLYRVHLFAQDPKVFVIRPPLEDALRLRTETWRASFS